MDKQYMNLEKSILEGDVDLGIAEAVNLAKKGVTPFQIFSECIEPVLTDVGDKFSRLEIFLPEMMASADVVKSIQEGLKPFLIAEQTQDAKGVVVIGSAYGDIHEIGKNIVKVMLEVNVFQVKDIGVDVPARTFKTEAERCNADILAISGLIMPALPYIRDTIDLINQDTEMKDRLKIMVGGGAASKDWAEGAGADAYGYDAAEAVEQAFSLVEKQ